MRKIPIRLKRPNKVFLGSLGKFPRRAAEFIGNMEKLQQLGDPAEAESYMNSSTSAPI
jgi:hypothetical protein